MKFSTSSSNSSITKLMRTNELNISVDVNHPTLWLDDPDFPLSVASLPCIQAIALLREFHHG